MDDSVVFAKLRQVQPHLKHASLGLHEFTSLTASRSVQPFLYSSRRRVPILHNGPPFPPQNCPFTWGIWTPSNTWFLGPNAVHNTASRSVQPFLQGSLLWPMTDRQTTVY